MASLKVKTAFTNAIVKYISNIKTSSGSETYNVNFGGIKKKSQISALSKATKRTGKISKNIATTETVNKRINATTLYPIKADKKKQIVETTTTEVIPNIYC